MMMVLLKLCIRSLSALPLCPSSQDAHYFANLFASRRADSLIDCSFIVPLPAQTVRRRRLSPCGSQEMKGGSQ